MNWNVEGPAVFLDMKYQTCFLHIESDQGFYSLIALGYSIPVPKHRKCPSDASDSEMMDFSQHRNNRTKHLGKWHGKC